MKRRDLLKRLKMEASKQGIPWETAREGGNHTIYRLGSTMIPVPRHNEINEVTAEAIFKQAETELGARWWR
jgi:hypothetical protein